jgi:hypothetical protein
MLKKRLIFYLNPHKIDMVFKITIGYVIDHYWIIILIHCDFKSLNFNITQILQ